MKKVFKILIPILVLLVLLTTGAYFFGVYYFRHWFCPNTYINEVKVSGKNFSEVEEMLLTNFTPNNISIVDIDGTELFINGDDIYNYNPDDAKLAFNKIINAENPFMWPYYLFNNHQYTYKAEVRLDEEKLDKIINDSFFADKKVYDENNSAEIIYTKKDGYVFVDNTNDLLDIDLLKEDIKALALSNGGKIEIEEDTYYKDVNHSKEYEKTLKEWKMIEKVIDFEMKYELASGEEIMVDSAVVSNLLARDEKGELLLNDDNEYYIDSVLVKEFVQKMSDDYDNMYKIKYFKATRGDVVEIPYTRYTTYGNLINVEEEAKELEQLLVSGKSPKTREPIYIQKEYAGTYANNYGGTYVEIDLTNQTMYYYLNNELQLETPIVTGCWANGNMTPSAVCFIVNKARNIWLDGPTWHSFVYHWMCITGQIGIHDSTWRSSYGGEIYRYGGSHGCINTPMDAVDELFNTVEIGTPVLVFE